MKVFFKHSTISVEFGHTKFLAILYNDRYNKNHTNEKEGKTLEKSIEVYGNIEIKDELDEKREEGIKEGIKEGESLGENRINQLILKLSELNRTDEILKAAADREYQKKLLKEFGL